jgi:hypothetical protein
MQCDTASQGMGVMLPATHAYASGWAGVAVLNCTHSSSMCMCVAARLQDISTVHWLCGWALHMNGAGKAVCSPFCNKAGLWC